MKYTKRSKQILTPFFSNLDKPVFVLQNMPEVLKGALFSRYSRSTKSLRELFLEEYVNNNEIDILKAVEDVSKFADSHKLLNTEKAQKFYRKWLAMYGDDSIAELAGIHIGIEDISMVATKSIEDRRIGVSPLEKSTRYVRYDDKVNGEYRYYRGSEIVNSEFSKDYISTMDYLFETYSNLIDPMMDYFRDMYKKPKDVSDKAYNSSIRAKACDTLRGLLPMGTLTNMGIFANGRAVEYMLTKMFSDPLPEANNLAKSILKEVKPSINNFVERIESEKGEAYIEYLKKTNKKLLALNKKILKDQKEKASKSSVKLIDYDRNAVNLIVVAILYPESNLSYKTIKNVVSKLSEDEKNKIILDSVKYRKGRWHKVIKAFEEVYYSFEIVSDIGAYKDLQRHRMTSMFRQLFTTYHGYEVPFHIKNAGYVDEYSKALDVADKLYRVISKKNKYLAQYVACHGHLHRWRVKFNLREAFHICELRSSPQGHPNYRVIAQKMYQLIKAKHWVFGEAMKFVSMSDVGLERLSAEVRKYKKLDQLGKI